MQKPHDISMYQGQGLENPEAEESAELERGAIARQIVEAWQPDGKGLDAVAPLISAIKQSLDEARRLHNERYVFALATEFNACTTDLALDPAARAALDKMLQEQLDTYRFES